MTTVDIADIDAALGKVRAFIALFEQATPPGRRRASTLIQVRSMAGRSASARPAIRMMSGNCSWIWLSVCVRRRGTVAPMAGPNTASGMRPGNLRVCLAQSTKQSRSLAQSDRS
jgi:hypothetical protein